MFLPSALILLHSSQVCSLVLRRFPNIPPARSRKVRIYLLSGISASGDDGNTADLEDCRERGQHFQAIGISITCRMRLHFMSTVVDVDCRVGLLEFELAHNSFCKFAGVAAKRGFKSRGI
jgi:hypothetical protein